MVCWSFKGRELLHDKHPRKIWFVFYILPATYSCLSETILLRYTKYSLEIELKKLSSPVPYRQSEQFSLKSIKGNLHTSKNCKSMSVYNWSFKIVKNYFLSKIIQRLNHLDNLTSYSKMKVLCASDVMIDNYGCMKAVTSKGGLAIP